MDGGKYGIRKEEINLEQGYGKWKQTLKIWKGGGKGWRGR